MATDYLVAHHASILTFHVTLLFPYSPSTLDTGPDDFYLPVNVQPVIVGRVTLLTLEHNHCESARLLL